MFKDALDLQTPEAIKDFESRINSTNRLFKKQKKLLYFIDNVEYMQPKWLERIVRMKVENPVFFTTNDPYAPGMRAVR